MDRLNIGEVLTVLKGVPYKFHVTAEETSPDFAGVINQFPYIYRFSDLRLKKESTPVNFVVMPTDELITFHFGDANTNLHKYSIKFGLRKIQEEIDCDRFDFLTTDYENMLRMAKKSGEDLRNKVLTFIASINKHFPGQNIRDDNLYFNIDGEEEEIIQWAEDLYKQGYFVQVPIDAPHRFHGGKEGAKFYKINSENREKVYDDIEKINLKNDELPVLIFLSYSTKNKVLAGRIKSELELWGLKVFLAHETIKISKPWEDEILLNLRNCHVFIPIITNNFRPSKWTDQEAGHALAGKKVIISLYTNKLPHGFLNRYQGEKIIKSRLNDICLKIIKTISMREETSRIFRSGLIRIFGESSSYFETISSTKKLVSLEDYGRDQIAKISNHILLNDQIYGCGAVRKTLLDFVKKNKDNIENGLYDKIFEKL